MLLTQVIIRRKSKRCLVQGDGIDPNIVQMYAEKKAQSGATFIALLHQIEAHLKTTKRTLDLPVYAPSIVLMDWAPCHGKEFLEQPEGEEQSAHLWMVKEIRDMWVFFWYSSKVSPLQSRGSVAKSQHEEVHPRRSPRARVRKSHCHVFLGGLDPGQAPDKTLLLMLRLTSLGASFDINVKVEYPKPKRIVFLPSAILAQFWFHWCLRIFIFYPFHR